MRDFCETQRVWLESRGGFKWLQVTSGIAKASQRNAMEVFHSAWQADVHSVTRSFWCIFDLQWTQRVALLFPREIYRNAILFSQAMWMEHFAFGTMFGRLDYYGWKAAHLKNNPQSEPKVWEWSFTNTGTCRQKTRDKGHTWEKPWNIPGTKWKNLDTMGFRQTGRTERDLGKVRERSDERALGWLPNVVSWIALTLESDGMGWSGEASQSWPRRCLQGSHCPTDCCRLCCWHFLGSLALAVPNQPS